MFTEVINLLIGGDVKFSFCRLGTLCQLVLKKSLKSGYQGYFYGAYHYRQIIIYVNVMYQNVITPIILYVYISTTTTSFYL